MPHSLCNEPDVVSSLLEEDFGVPSCFYDLGGEILTHGCDALIHMTPSRGVRGGTLIANVIYEP
jgi:hypothetical protein